MVADLRKMQEYQWVSEIRIDKPEFNGGLIDENKKSYAGSNRY